MPSTNVYRFSSNRRTPQHHNNHNIHTRHCHGLFIRFYTFRRHPLRRPRIHRTAYAVYTRRRIYIIYCYIMYKVFAGIGHTCDTPVVRSRISVYGYFSHPVDTPPHNARGPTMVSSNAETGLPRRTEFRRGGDLLTQFFCGPFFSATPPHRHRPTDTHAHTHPPTHPHNATTMRIL